MQKKLTFLILWVSLFVSPSGAGNLDEEIRLLERFSKAYHIIKEKHISGISSSELINASIKGMVEALDEHSKVLSKEEFELLEGLSLGRFVGIGITLGKDENAGEIRHVTKRSPAAKAGIKRGNIIIAINGKPIKDLPLEKLQKLTLGAIGTTLSVTFKRGLDSEEITKKLVREKIIEHSVKLIEKDGIFILQISSFQKGTPSEVKEKLLSINKKPLLMDLRDNRGGLLLAAVETTDLFLDSGKIVEVKDKFGENIEKYVSMNKKINLAHKPILLINQNTASAAEILAGTLKERNAARLVGSKSYGKGTVQTLYALSDDGYLKLTNARYYTPGGKSFDGIGVEPDVEVLDELDSEDQRYSKEDKAYQKALNLLRQR